MLLNSSEYNRRSALRALLSRNRDEVDQCLLSEDLDRDSYFFMDPKEPITAQRVAEAAEKLDMPRAEIKKRYQDLAKEFHLILDMDE